MKENPYFSKDFLINNMSKEERLKLKQSLLGQIVKIRVDDVYGLFTEHGFPVAVATYEKIKREYKLTEFEAEVIEVNPMITIYAIP